MFEGQEPLEHECRGTTELQRSVPDFWGVWGTPISSGLRFWGFGEGKGGGEGPGGRSGSRHENAY